MRKKNSIFNMLGSLGSYLFATIFTFITQACIVRILGIEYSGVNGLFTNILTMLSVAELGIGTTIIFKLYKPIAEDNKEEIKSWMNFYKICYRCVALVITIVGLLIIPIVPTIVGEVAIPESIIFLYLISLLDTILSYVMTYKRSLLYADQKNYIVNIVHMGYTVFMNITQIILLAIFKNYVVFLAIKLIYRLLENVIINIYVNKHYQYINEPAKKLEKQERKDVINRIKAIFLQKISFVINKGIDNIVLSIFLGITVVGYYTNYNMIVSAITTIIYQILSSLTASVGNLLTENNTEKSYDIYKKINMLNSFITGIFIVGFTCAIQPFITLWVGKEYLLSNFTIWIFAFYIYSDSIRRAITMYKEAAGICEEDQFMYVIMAIINLVTSIILCKIMGVSGVILGTAISYLFLIIYSYPKYIYKPIFHKSYQEYYGENVKYFVYIVIATVLSAVICNAITIGNSLWEFICNGIIAVGIAVILFIILFGRSKEFRYYIEMLKEVKARIIK